MADMTVGVEQYRRMMRETRPSKHRNVKTVVDGITFASKLEAKRYGQLKQLADAGLIEDLRMQPEFVLMNGFRDRRGRAHRAVKYIADFAYVLDGELIVEDTKGRKTELFKLKEKMFMEKYPDIDFRILTKEDF